MEFGLARYWWILALRGVVAILFGVLAFLWPGFLWLVVVATFAVYAFLDGVLAIMAAVSTHGHGERWWALVLEGVVGITAAILAIALPVATQVALLYLIAAWLIATGVFEIIAAIRLRQYIRGEWLLALSGVLSILLGLVLGIAPFEGLVVVAWIIGAYAVAFGVLMLVLAFRLRSLARHVYRAGGTVAMT